MLKHLVIALSLIVAGPAFSHTDSKFTKGPNGGHIVDTGGGRQHWELVAKGGELTLFVTDKDEKPIAVSSGGTFVTCLAFKTAPRRRCSSAARIIRLLWRPPAAIS